jgi:predicted metalloprotease
MRWTPGGTSEDIEDRRDDSGGGGGGFGFGGFGGRHIGIGGLLFLGLLSIVFKRDLLSPFLGGGAVAPSASVRTEDPARKAAEQPMVEFVSFVIDDLQRTWAKMFPDQFGGTYRKAKLVLFHDVLEDAGCGVAQSAMGPFYCPADEKVYIDLGFYNELKNRFGASGDFAQAYVIAHEIGHHIQNLAGIERKMRAAQRQNPGAANRLSVAMELQADCFAGMWGHSTAERNILEKGDVESGLNAAAAIGDDRIQQMSTGHVSPEKFTHGSSEQRVEWFKRGLDNGQARSCDTFGTMF